MQVKAITMEENTKHYTVATKDYPKLPTTTSSCCSSDNEAIEVPKSVYTPTTTILATMREVDGKGKIASAVFLLLFFGFLSGNPSHRITTSKQVGTIGSIFLHHHFDCIARYDYFSLFLHPGSSPLPQSSHT